MPAIIYLFLNLGGGEVFFILVVVLLFFGSSRIPELARGLGKGMREFKDAMGGIEREVREASSQDSAKKVNAPTTTFNTPAPPPNSVMTTGESSAPSPTTDSSTPEEPKS